MIYNSSSGDTIDITINIAITLPPPTHTHTQMSNVYVYYVLASLVNRANNVKNVNRVIFSNI